MDTTTTRSRAGRWATVAVVAGIAAGVPSAAIAGPQPVADIHHRASGAETTTVGRPCFIIQSHWNPAYDGFVPVCGQTPSAVRDGCPPPPVAQYVGAPCRDEGR